MHYLRVTKYRRHGLSWKSLYRQAEIAQLGERQTEDLKVPGSNPGLGIDGGRAMWGRTMGVDPWG